MWLVHSLLPVSTQGEWKVFTVSSNMWNQCWSALCWQQSGSQSFNTSTQYICSHLCDRKKVEQHGINNGWSCWKQRLYRVKDIKQCASQPWSKLTFNGCKHMEEINNCIAARKCSITEVQVWQEEIKRTIKVCKFCMKNILSSETSTIQWSRRKVVQYFNSRMQTLSETENLANSNIDNNIFPKKINILRGSCLIFK